MNNALVRIAAVVLCAFALPAAAQHHDYRIHIENETGRDLHVSCHDDDTGEEATEDVHAGDHATLSVHGSEHMHMHCTAGDHRGNTVAQREFEFNHRRTSRSWVLQEHHGGHHDH